MSEAVRLLIIDDEEIVIKSCLKIFKNSGYSIDSAKSGEEGLKKVQENKYDIVITDLKMPGIGGIGVLKTIKEKYPHLVVIVFTGYASINTARESLKLGAFDYIPKPFTPEEIREVVTNAIKSLKDNSSAKMLDLMAIVAHEFKSPVSTVHTTADTLYGGYFGKLTSEQQTVIETIMRNCQYLEDIIRCYIDLSKVELNGLDFLLDKEIDLVTDIVQPVLETPEYQRNLKKMTITADYARRPKLTGNPDLLKIVINNLVNNAIKYGHPATEIKIRVYQADPYAVVTIYNEGVGITQEAILNRLFKKFERLKQKGAEGTKGSGLGLYICKTIVEKHGGKMEVLAEVDKYAEFRVYLRMPPAPTSP